MRSYQTNLLLNPDLDRLAEAIHEGYFRQCEIDQRDPLKYPAFRRWEDLADRYKNANRQQADHISIKLRAVGCQAVPCDRRAGRPETAFATEEIELLAQMEHQRWCANRWLDGWQLGARDDSLKRHPNLVPWEELNEGTKQYDRSAAVNIPALLGLVGRVMVRSSDWAQSSS